jgi:sulfur relay (sulfurtransferase) complex TusBCD TusD component (DsrE family)
VSARRLGIVVSTAPARGDFERAARLARAARARGVEVSVFLMDAAAVYAGDARATSLLEDGCEVFLCGTSQVQLGVRAVPGVVEGGQNDHAHIAHFADRLVAFT